MPRWKKQSYYNKRGRKIYKFRRYRPSRTRYLRKRMYKLAKQLNVEYKRIYTQYSGNTIDQSLAIGNLNIIDIGTGASNRIGRFIKITRLNIKGFFKINSSATNTQIRCIILIDKQVNQSTFSSSDLLNDTSANDILVSSLNLDNNKRFKILYDRLFWMSQEKPVAKIRYNKNLNLKIAYDASTSSVADQTQKALYICFVSNEATNTPNAWLNCVTRYVDN